ncbi:hypothetical protein ACHAW6_001442 [Cyclotella cf. meneghiniana]
MITSTWPAILQGRRDKNGPWRIPLTECTSILHHPVGHCINNIYDLPSTAHSVQYIHVALSFPTKNMLLTEIHNGYLNTFPGLASTNTINQCWQNSQIIHLNWHVLDNKAPCKLKTAIRSNGCTIELAPPDVHQCNNAEHTIQTFKSHFITILSGVDNLFPITEWDSLITQTILTLNLLCNANVEP